MGGRPPVPRPLVTVLQAAAHGLWQSEPAQGRRRTGCCGLRGHEGFFSLLDHQLLLLDHVHEVHANTSGPQLEGVFYRQSGLQGSRYLKQLPLTSSTLLIEFCIWTMGWNKV